VGLQCKQEANFGPADVTAAIEKVPERPTYPADQYRILLSREATDLARQRARETPGWEILDRADLSRMVRELPLEAAVDLVSRYFGRFWVERFLRVERPATFVGPERYFRPYVHDRVLLNHDRPLRGRDDALREVEAWYAGQGRVLILDGRLGIGTSKLVYEFARRGQESIAMPLPGNTIDADALNEVQVGRVLVAVDDADQRDLAGLFAYVARDTEKRLLLVCQPGSVQPLMDGLIAAGIPRPDVKRIGLLGLGRADTIALAKDTAPALNDDAVEQVVMRASDTPLATIVTARLIAAGSTEEAVGIFDEVTALQRTVIEGRIDPGLSRDHVRLVLRLVAALGPLRSNDAKLIGGAIELGMTEDEAARTIAAVSAAGGFAQYGAKIAVSPSVVRDGILIDACTSGAAVDPFVQRLYEMFGFDKKLFRNLVSANEAARATGKPAFFDALWRRITTEVVEMDNARRLEFVKSVRAVAPVQPGDTIRLLRTLHRNPPQNDEQQFGDFYRITAGHVDAEIPPVLGDILEHYPDYAKACVDLLWELAASDSRALNSHPEAAMRVLREAAGYDGALPAAREALVEAVAALLQRPDLDERLHSPVDVLEPILARDGYASRSRGEMLQFTQYSVPLSRFAAIRDRALTLCLDAMFGDHDRRAVRAMRIVTKILSGISGLGTQDEDVERLREEQARVLDACEKLAADGNELRRIVLRDEMVKYDRWTGETGDRFKRIIASIPIDDKAMLYRAVAPEIARHWPHVENGVEALHAHERDLALERAHVVRHLTAQFPEHVAMRDGLEALSREVAAAGFNPSLGNLLGQLAFDDLDRAMDLARAALEQPAASYVRGALAPILAHASASRPEEGAALSAAAMSGDEDVREAAAAALRVPLASADMNSAEVQNRFRAIARMLNDDSPAVRSAVRLGAAFLVDRVPNLSAPLIDAVQTTEGELLDWIYAGIPRDDEGKPTISDETYARLARRLTSVDAIEWNEVGFLADGFPRNAGVVLEVLEARMMRPYKRDFRAIPHDPSLDQLTKSIVVSGAVNEAVAIAVHAMADSSLHQYDAHELVGRLYAHGPDQTRDALFLFIRTADGEQLAAIASLLTDAPPEHLFEDVEMFTALVEGGFRHGVEQGNNVVAALGSALLHRGHLREGRENSPVAVKLRDALRTALERAEPASDSEAFFKSLLEETERELDRERHDDAETFGPE
jgi:hypothetical protein